MAAGDPDKLADAFVDTHVQERPHFFFGVSCG
jgi:hypothetical protein